MDLIVGVKTYVELEGEINMRELSFTFLNREVPIFPVYKEMIKPKERRYLKVEAPFLDEISSLGIIKLLTWDAYNTLTMKVNFERNKDFEITNDSTQVIVLDPKRDIVILDIRSLGITTYSKESCNKDSVNTTLLSPCTIYLKHTIILRISCKKKR